MLQLDFVALSGGCRDLAQAPTNPPTNRASQTASQPASQAARGQVVNVGVEAALAAGVHRDLRGQPLVAARLGDRRIDRIRSGPTKVTCLVAATSHLQRVIPFWGV